MMRTGHDRDDCKCVGHTGRADATTDDRGGDHEPARAHLYVCLTCTQNMSISGVLTNKSERVVVSTGLMGVVQFWTSRLLASTRPPHWRSVLNMVSIW